jgi:hypothetical protein
MKLALRLSRRALAWASLAAGAIALAAALPSCGEKTTPFDTNLLKNPSFEDVENGTPKHWQLGVFRGLEGQPEVRYGVDTEFAVDGQNSWRFSGDPGTRRWYVLTQEVEVRDVAHIRLQGWIQTDQVRRGVDQHSQSNYLLTFFDENHTRFSDLRFMDKRSRFRAGTNPWMEEDFVVKLPEGTRYVLVSCVLGCDGTAWFDNVSLSAVTPIEWQTQRTKNFVFHWVPEKPFPPGSIENQQRLFDTYAARLGIESDQVVGYYLYPDTATIRATLSIRSYQFINHSDLEIHTINPNENHEIIHFLTDPYGVPPRAILEGTVFMLHGTFNGRSVHTVTAQFLRQGSLPTLRAMIDQATRTRLDPQIWVPASASFVGFLVEMWGPQRLLELYRAPTGSTSYEQFARAFETVYGSSCDDAEKQWRTLLLQMEQREKSQQEESQQEKQ